MPMSRAAWEEKTAAPEGKEPSKNDSDKTVDKVPGDKGSTVDKIRQANERLRKAIDEE